MEVKKENSYRKDAVKNNFKIPLIAGEIDMLCRRIVIFGLLILLCVQEENNHDK